MRSPCFRICKQGSKSQTGESNEQNRRAAEIQLMQLYVLVCDFCDRRCSPPAFNAPATTRIQVADRSGIGHDYRSRTCKGRFEKKATHRLIRDSWREFLPKLPNNQPFVAHRNLCWCRPVGRWGAIEKGQPESRPKEKHTIWSRVFSGPQLSSSIKMMSLNYGPHLPLAASIPYRQLGGKIGTVTLTLFSSVSTCRL